LELNLNSLNNLNDNLVVNNDSSVINFQNSAVENKIKNSGEIFYELNKNEIENKKENIEIENTPINIVNKNTEEIIKNIENIAEQSVLENEKK